MFGFGVLGVKAKRCFKLSNSNLTLNINYSKVQYKERRFLMRTATYSANRAFRGGKRYK